MTIRIHDRFDKNFTAVVWDNVEVVYGDTVYFNDGTEETFDNQSCDYEIIEK